MIPATTVAPIRSPLNATNSPPQKAHPTYPAGITRNRTPPVYPVTPPSLLYTSIFLTDPPVIQQADACYNNIEQSIEEKHKKKARKKEEESASKVRKKASKATKSRETQ